MIWRISTLSFEMWLS